MPQQPPPDAPEPVPGAADAHAPDWDAVERDPEFRRLKAEKRRFILPATLFFIAYYFALPVLVGYFPETMGRDVFGEVNLAYLFALSQFFMAWALMWMYVRRARGFDAMAERLAGRITGGAR
ncbi:MAG TPA: DUF485 domain-containing protein [Longimicrobiaceae bacterium]|nr:DUF485 domain-containing protein [Longimicrobiaceae bacterium]